MRPQRWRTVMIVALVGLSICSIDVGMELASVDWDPTYFTAFGEASPEIAQYAKEKLGEVHLRAELGHDGRFFFVQANDPWLMHPADNASVLDRPVYRSQRMLFPVLAGGAGFFEPRVIVWAMLFVNLVAMGIGTAAAARLAQEMGGSAWWGLSFALNPGFFSEIGIGGAGVVAGAAAFVALLFLMQGFTARAVALLTLAALAREVILIVAVGSAVWLWSRTSRRQGLWVAAIPALAVAGWGAYTRFRLASEIEGPQVQEIGVPFRGLLEAASAWGSDALSLAAGLVVLVVLGWFLVKAVQRRSLLDMAFIGFVPLALVLSEQVWHSYFDILRAVAPVFTAFVLVTFAFRSQDGPDLATTRGRDSLVVK